MEYVTERRVSESFTEQVHVVKQSDLNPAGRLFGGMLMQWIDEVAGVVGRRHSNTNITTASIDNLNFIRGAYLGDTVVIHGRITCVGNTSMDVKVESFIETLDNRRIEINCAYLALVALDENDKPTRVPRLILETEEERKEWENAKIRKEIRMKAKREGILQDVRFEDENYKKKKSCPS